MADLAFGEWLKRRRRALGLTQDELARQINCSTSALRKIEGGIRRPSEQIVEQLAAVFSIVPSERLSFLRFARGQQEAAPTELMVDSPWHSADMNRRSNLPASISSFIGREKEIVAVGEYLSDADIRLVTLFGAPGIGKTRLSLEVARKICSQFPNGVFFVGLALLSDPNLFAPTIIQTLGLGETKSETALQRLKDGIGGKEMLLVLDNFEHLIETAAPFVSELLISCPHLKILITSREPLHILGEWLYSVPLLKTPTISQLQSIDIEGESPFAALELFAQRARAVRSDFVLNADNIQAVGAICAQLDGLPLAIELIAARIRLMTPQTLLQRLNNQYVLSADGIRSLPPRQRTLHDTISWSYDLLSDEEQKLFTRLSVFSSSFTLEAVQSICSKTVMCKSVADLISSLMDKSLLECTIDAQGRTRINMLATIQHFAQEKLTASGEAETYHRAHLEYFLNLAEEANPKLRGSEQMIWLNLLEREHDNLRVALQWSITQEGKDADKGMQLAGHLWWFWYLRGYWSEGRKWLTINSGSQNLATLGPSACTVSRARALGYAGIFHDDLVQASRLYEKSLALCRELGDQAGTAYALLMQGHYATISLRDKSASKLFLEESLNIYLALDDKWGIARVLFEFGQIAHFLDYDAPVAHHYYEESLKLSRKIGERQSITYALNNLGNLAMEQGNITAARSFFEESLSLAQELHDKSGIVMFLASLGEATLGQGDYQQAAKLFEESLAIARELGRKVMIAYALCYLGRAARFQGDYERAAKLQAESLVSGRDGDDKDIIAEALCRLGELARLQGNYIAAHSFHLQALNMAREANERRVISNLIEEFATLSATQRDAKRAAVLFGAAEALRETSHRAPSPIERAELDGAISAVRGQLDDENFNTAWAEGSAMTIEQAIEFVLVT